MVSLELLPPEILRNVSWIFLILAFCKPPTSHRAYGKLMKNGGDNPCCSRGCDNLGLPCHHKSLCLEKPGYFTNSDGVILLPLVGVGRTKPPSKVSKAPQCHKGRSLNFKLNAQNSFVLKDLSFPNHHFGYPIHQISYVYPPSHLTSLRDDASANVPRQQIT